MKEWQIFPKAAADFFRNYPDINPVVLQLLFNRGLKEKIDIKSFLNCELAADKTLAIGENQEYVFYDPFLFRDMAAAVDLIIAHIKKGSPIVIYGDYDADGVTASVILLETLKILHAQVEVYLPDRVAEGYGLNKAAINQLAAQGVKLLITVDNGIRNFAEVAYAKSKGLEVIITDHHVLPENRKEIPDCLYIDPADQEDNYPWPYLAGVGVSFKLISALLAKANLPDKQKQLIMEKSLDLVAVGTVADMVSLLGENRLLVKSGLKILNQNRRLGLNELIKVSKINNGRPLEAWNIGWQIGPRLNAASRLSHANTAFELLTTTDAAEAKELAAELNQRNINRQRITEEIISQVEVQIDKDNLPNLIVGVAGENQIWNEGVIGLVAGKIAEKYYRPTLIITRLIEEAEFDADTKKLVPKKVSFKGSGRSVDEFNLIEAIEDCAPNLDKFGGHPMACGFSINSEVALDKFISQIQEIAEQKITQTALVPKLKIEMELDFSAINLDLAEAVNSLAPHGQNNPQPRFVSYHLRIDDIVTMGFDNQHIKMRLSKVDPSSGTTSSFWALAFGGAANYKECVIGDYIDLVYYLEINDFNGRREPQLKIIDLKKYE
ncbi:single-stranded-DNA-specific exonuclease RecJ [Candidatus Falkowbacteria bacterium]|jgi:single-stranded-DNA-specific exonuclease|nr:single-stranded-DNA-specific exonuclease RecJ [Candidatus Falkowbacteria bacterium]